MVHEGVVTRRQLQHKKRMWSRFLHRLQTISMSKQRPGWLSKSKLGKLKRGGCSIILPPSHRVMLKCACSLFSTQHFKQSSLNTSAANPGAVFHGIFLASVSKTKHLICPILYTSLQKTGFILG